MTETAAATQTAAILVVDDSLTVRMDLSERLTERGHLVHVAASLAQASAALEQQPISLMILDVHLPDGDGVSYLKALREGPHAELPVVLLSSKDDVGDRLRGLSGGAQEFAGKPYDGDGLIAMVERFLPQSDRPAAGHLLLIDDSATYRAALGEVLAAEGFAVIHATCGLDGLRAAGMSRPTAILCDGQLPDIDGAEVIRRIRLDPALRDVPCLMLTGSSASEVEIAALQAGADDFIDKGRGLEFAVGKLRALVRALHQRQSTGEANTLSRRVLAVDDSETFLQVTAERLRACGYDMILARSGEEALALLAVQQVDCVLLDWQMPGLSGEETVQRIRSNGVHAGLPVLMLSANEEEQVMLSGMRAGADDYVTKGGGFEVLRARVEAHLRRKQQGDEVRRLEGMRLRAELAAREAEARHEREQSALRAKMMAEVERANAELARQNRRLASQREEIAQFAWLTSHDLLTPLRSVHMFAELLARRLGPALDAESSADLQHIREGAGRMRELVRGLQGYLDGRNEEGQEERVDLGESAQRIVRRMERSLREIDAKVVVGPLPTVHGTRRQWDQVFDHLLANALRYRACRLLEVEITAKRQEDGRWCVSVRDNGSGFDPAHASKIFQLFTKIDEDRGGSGVGLSICRRIVEQQGGEIWFEAELGSGATFFFTVQAAEAIPEQIST